MTGKVISPSIKGQRRSAAIWIVASIALALLAALATQHYLNEREAAMRQANTPDEDGHEVIVAVETLNAGETLVITRLAVRRIPADLMPEDGVSPEAVEGVLGKVLVQTLPAGRPLTYAMLYQSAGNRITRLLKPGERAVTLPLSEESFDGGTLEAGVTVDLILLEKDKKIPGHLLKEGATLLAVNGVTAAEQQMPGMVQAPTNERTITIAINPDEADRIAGAADALGSNKAHLLAFLRHPDDDTQPYVIPPKPAPVYAVTVFEGGMAQNGQLQPQTLYFGGANKNPSIYGDQNRAVARVKHSTEQEVSDAH